MKIRDAIRELGYEPRRRNVWYQLLAEPESSPAHAVPAYEAVAVQRQYKHSGEASPDVLLPVINRA